MNIFRWWHSIALPRDRDRSTPLERQRCRYEDLTSNFVLFLTVCFLPMFPVMAFYSPQSPSSPPAAYLALASLISAFVAGRLRFQKSSASFAVLYLFATVAIPVLFNPDLPLVIVVAFGFILAIVLAGALITPRASTILAILSCLFLLGTVFLVPHPASYIAVVSTYHYSVFVYLPVFLFLLIGICMSIILSQLNQTILRADRAEEIIALQAEISRYEERRKIELALIEQGVKEIAEAHRQFANGNVHVRVPIERLASMGENNPLIRVAFSLNTLFGRVQRWREQGAAAERTERVISEIVRELQQRSTDDTLSDLPLRTGTLIDPLLIELKTASKHYR